MTPLLSVGKLFVIQKDLKKEDEEILKKHPDILFLGNMIESFEDSAAIIQEMDLIISVDTSLGHLAGALGKKTFMLLPWNSEWRWLLERRDSPWYPTMELFRQPSMGQWESVIKSVLYTLVG